MSRFSLLAVILILVPTIEIFTFVQVGQSIGYLPALLVLILMTLLGSYLLRREGLATVSRVVSSVAAGQPPAMEVLEGLMVGVAALFLLIPGFVSDIIGLTLLIPFTRRALLKFWLGRKLKNVQDIAANLRTSAKVVPPEQIVMKPQGQTHYDYEGEYVRKD
ncbi:FxsA family protein [Thiofilum flexile]|uniref:FxsA family protein n=1 Tax=Thiofilum flexile TaxID=125627 RepID=UPI00036DABBB|nr:FxsA family protein [Thiofilum flexile]